MRHPGCPSCRLRFTAAAAAGLDQCPDCGQPLQVSSPRDTVGFRLFGIEDLPPSLPEAAASLPEAVAVSIPVPEHPRDP